MVVGSFVLLDSYIILLLLAYFFEMSNNKKPAKPLNPEEKLQASVGKDVKIRLMEEHLKFQSNIVSAAK